jgi:hypothetical protein
LSPEPSGDTEYLDGQLAEATIGVTADRYRPILLKKSVMVSTAEKYALEFEIFTLSRGFRAQISRSGVQKRSFQRSVCGQLGKTDFFNRIGQKQTVIKVKDQIKL